jgi:hypothetical protein
MIKKAQYSVFKHFALIKVFTNVIIVKFLFWLGKVKGKKLLSVHSSDLGKNENNLSKLNAQEQETD